ncbi:flagellar biosynthetic protein FliR [Sphingomonas sp. NIBR02145]|uniref:flagellar biosynthetic protein FliR n=1 Tax=Sphingomonas sp. NIBR02145 TaxID=3014784 RepID=UPI0022B47E97|nr:flagellar biosynthetic protein FliR [Sphingomonas sp. NIBR02145]WHU04986.1 flagellar biosynthetic protein FliR [Sphingomonas sp. NIBR02145]
MEDLTDQAVAVLLLSLRIAPMLGFAQPFTLLRIPAMVRMMLGISLAAWLVHGNPEATWRAPFWDAGLPMVAAGELFLGVSLALALQLAFAALLTAGRTIDIQAGFGLAVLVDPTTRSQMPLAGTLFAYAGAAVFFGIGGPQDLLAVWAASVEKVPLGAASLGGDPAPMLEYMGAVFLMAIGLAGIVLLILFLLDLIVAFLSRTLPQMNVLLLGFQVKAIATMAALPFALSFSGALFAQLMRGALEVMPRLI